MNPDRVRKIALPILLVLAVGAFAWFGLIKRQPRHEAAMQAANHKDVYYCPMHKNYRADKPGVCPICSMKLVKLEEHGKPEPSADAPSAATPPASPTQENAIFVPPEKQQLIGMRSVAAEVGTLTKDIRLVGRVSYDETRVTHIHSKVSGYVEEVFADSVGNRCGWGSRFFTIYSPDLVATEQDYLLALRSRELLRTSQSIVVAFLLLISVVPLLQVPSSAELKPKEH
jgi:Cu(I)/Ag(I) efflux system membrane fusion protein